jgi:hypothetical protein
MVETHPEKRLIGYARTQPLLPSMRPKKAISFVKKVAKKLPVFDQCMAQR